MQTCALSANYTIFKHVFSFVLAQIHALHALHEQTNKLFVLLFKREGAQCLSSFVKLYSQLAK